MSNHKYQVIIVGGGPVGVGLAIELGLRHISVALVEQYKTPQAIPKGQNLTQRTLEHFYFWGIEDEIRAARAMPSDYPIGGVIVYGSLDSNYWYEWHKRELVRPYYFTDNERLPQYATEAVLRGRLAALPTVDCFFGWSAEEITQDESRVQVSIRERKGSGRQQLTGTYLVGCDGSHSLVRTQAGITQTFSDHQKRMVLLVFRSTELHEIMSRFPGKSFYNVVHPRQKGYWQFFGRVDVGESWFFHAPVPENTTKKNFDFRALLYQVAGMEFACEFDYIGFWDLRFALADSYRQGPVFIAGDACHSHPPYGGYGINLGFEDARNLGWKLAAVLEGWGSEKLLDSYGEERHPIFQSTAEQFIQPMIERDKLFTAQYNPEHDLAAFEEAWEARYKRANYGVNSFEPHYEGSAVVFGPPNGRSSAVGSHQFKAQAGHHLPPQMLSTGQNIFEQLGSGFTLLTLDADAAVVEAFAKAAAQLHIPLKIIEDSLADGRVAYEATLILIRPDQYVAWCDNAIEPEQVSQLLKRCVGL